MTGPPGLASAAQQQGRLVAHALFQHLRQPILSRLQQEQLLEVKQAPPGRVEEAAVHKQQQQQQQPDADPERLALFGSARDAPMTFWTIPEMASVGLSIRFYSAGC